MKFYKKALLATAIATTFGANAASIGVNNIQKLSAEGVAAGLEAGDAQLVFDVIVEKNHPAASRITLSFDKNVDLGDLTSCATGTVFGKVVTDPASGNGVCGELQAPDNSVTPAVPGEYALQFDYGTGSFTFDNVLVVDGDATKGETDSISFDVNLGNPLIADSAFRVIIGNKSFSATPNTLSSLKGESYVNYSSANGDTFIEDGKGLIASVESQFAFKVNTKFDGIIDRDDLTTFIDGSTDKTKYTFVNKGDLLASLDLDSVTISYAGNFDSVVDGELDLSTVEVNPTSTTTPTPENAFVKLDSTGKKEVAVYHLLDTVLLNDNETNTYEGVIDFTRDVNTAEEIPTTTPTVVTVSFDSTAGLTKAIDDQVIATDIAGGEWKIDATIINVPYYVVNHADTQSNIHMANEADEVADVIISAIDDNGTEYGPVDLGIDLAGNTVTKVKPKQIKEALGIDDTTVLKLSVTFNIDAYAQDVAAYAFSQNSQGRSEVSNSQYKVDGKVVKTK